MPEQKLDMGNKHLLKLIARDRKADGWAEVSATLWPHLIKSLPAELVDFDAHGDACKVRLTQTGQNIVDAMAWL